MKLQAKELALLINGIKRELDSMSQREEQLKANRQAKGGDAAQVRL